MRKALRRLATWLGVRTWYHVAAIYSQDSHVSTSVISLTVGIRPWLHEDNYCELVDFVKSKVTRPVAPPTITSVTKLGL